MEAEQDAYVYIVLPIYCKTRGVSLWGLAAAGRMHEYFTAV